MHCSLEQLRSTVSFNSFVPNAPLLYPLKTSENLTSYRRLIDVETTSCVYWEAPLFRVDLHPSAEIPRIIFPKLARTVTVNIKELQIFAVPLHLHRFCSTTKAFSS